MTPKPHRHPEHCPTWRGTECCCPLNLPPTITHPHIWWAATPGHHTHRHHIWKHHIRPLHHPLTQHHLQHHPHTPPRDYIRQHVIPHIHTGYLTPLHDKDGFVESWAEITYAHPTRILHPATIWHHPLQ